MVAYITYIHIMCYICAVYVITYDNSHIEDHESRGWRDGTMVLSGKTSALHAADLGRVLFRIPM